MEEEEYTYAIVGGGIAGVSCVEQILEYEPEARILLISSSSVVKEASNVTRLTKTLQDFVLVEKSLKSFKDVHQSVRVVQDKVLSLNTESHIVVTEGGERFKYRKICICTGGSPKLLFKESEFVIGIRDTQSVQDLANRITKARRVLLLGNGGIATEFVHEVDGVEILWAIKDKSISSHFVDAGAAEFFIQARLSQKSQTVDSLEEMDDVPSQKKMKTDLDLAESDRGLCKPKLDDGPQVSKRLKYTLSSQPPVKYGDSSAEKVGLGSALGPDWHQDINLKGIQCKKNVRILYETECLHVINLNEICDQVLESNTETKDWPVFAELTNGQVVGADLIISATGVKPNCEWASNCEQDPEKGIFVDAAMRTSVPDVFAAGDVCFPKWTWAKHWFQMRLWTQARQMGLYAGKSMYLSYTNDELHVGSSTSSSQEAEEIELDFCFEIFSHVTKFFDFKVVLLGLFNGQNLNRSKQHLLLRCTNGVEYIKVVMEDWRMQGAILIGETGLEETFENLILNQVDLSSYGEDLLNPDIDIEDYFD